jgi:hypothetical protein
VRGERREWTRVEWCGASHGVGLCCWAVDVEHDGLGSRCRTRTCVAARAVLIILHLQAPLVAPTAVAVAAAHRAAAAVPLTVTRRRTVCECRRAWGDVACI